MPDQPPSREPRANPYVGPKPFATDEGDRFFGRQTEILELTSLIVSHREVVLYSQSGAGKTSLLRAGIYPRLEGRGFEVLPPARVVGPPLPDADIEDQSFNIYAWNVLRGWASEGTDPSTLRDKTLTAFLTATSQSGPAKRLRIVIFDQFEELFTTYLERWKDRAGFMRQVAEALEADRTLRIVFALREEYVGRLRRHAELFPGGLRQWFYLERLREASALEAVKLPAEAAGRPYDDHVAEMIVARLLPIRIRTESGQVKEIPGEFVEPVHLQIVCRRLWDRIEQATAAKLTPAASHPSEAGAADATARTISASDVTTHGKVADALREYYEEQIAEVSKETGISRRVLRRWFERKFVTEEGGRARVFEQDGRVAGLPIGLARKFQAAYLLRSDSQGDVTWFELAHDRLLGPVQMARQIYHRRLLVRQASAAAVLLALGFTGGLIVYGRQAVVLPAAAPAEIAIRTSSAGAAETGTTTKTAPSDMQLITIQVVVHIVYGDPKENITDAQVSSQIAALNEDFRAQNADIATVPQPFKAAIGDAYIRFVLASVDPRGQPTTGITRRQTSVRGFSTDDKIKAASKGGVDPWPTDRYLNIWVANLSGGMLANAQLPEGPAATDGVVINYQAFGRGGSAMAPFNLGRSATHAIGQYFNLRNIWADTPDCTGSDNVADTPNQAGPNFGTPTFPVVSCDNGPNGAMFMNFMDYTDDAVMVMFTKGQVARMRETLSTSRRSLWSR